MRLEVKFGPIAWILHQFVWQLLGVTSLRVDALVVEELAKRVEELELLVFALGLGSALVVNLVFGGWFAGGVWWLVLFFRSRSGRHAAARAEFSTDVSGLFQRELNLFFHSFPSKLYQL